MQTTGPTYEYGGAAPQSAQPQAHIPPNDNNSQQHHQQQVGAPNPFGGYPGQQQHQRPSMTMSGGPPPQGGNNPGFMHPQAAPNPAHRNSLPPPMNMGHHQYINQGGYNPNFNLNQQGMPPQQQHQQHPHYGHIPQQHGYPPQQQQQHPMQYGGQQIMQQPYIQQPSYNLQNSNAGSVQTNDNLSSAVTGGPLNFNPSPALDGSTQGTSPNGTGLGGEYGQQFLPSGLNGNWQSDNDMHHRREMIQNLVKLLKQKDKNSSPEWLTKLPQMVKQLEVSLYRSAPSFEAYSDTSTLKSRLQQLAMEIAKKTQQARNGSVGGDNDGGGGGSSSSRGQSSRHSSSQENGSDDAMNNFNVPSDAGDAGGDDTISYQHGNPDDPELKVSNQHGNPDDPEWKVRIRHKQQRLLLLHHSSKCPFDDGKCKTTPYCGEMKKLWKHMARCTDNDCRVAHCFSSRSILSHYRKCKDPRCPACGPVRDTVRKTQESQRRKSQTQSGNDTMGGENGYGMPQDAISSNSMDIFQQVSSCNAPPLMLGGGHNGMIHPVSMSGVAMNGGINGAMPPNNMSSMYPPLHQNQSRSMGPPQPMMNGMTSHSGRIQHMTHPRPGIYPGAPNGDNAETDAKARHKRQRLLLLRHASKCTAETGTCTITPHCADMKILWKHIANCKDSYCKVRHCMSSRYVLSHYRRCKPPCNICDPVKDIIKTGFNNIIEVDPAIMGAAQQLSDPSLQQPPTKRQKLEGINEASAVSSQQEKEYSQFPKPTNPTEDYSLLECFTSDQVKTHIQSLKLFAKLAPPELKIKCLELLKTLQAHEHGWVFAAPVNPEELGLVDYFEIIKKPMDLGTIQRKIDAGAYHSLDDFRSDVRLTFENAMKYNEERTVVHEMAKEMKKKFEVDLKKLMKLLEKDHLENSKKVQACGLCACEKLNFESPVFFCFGANCPTTRIRRNTHFYSTQDKQYTWCNQCFGELKGDTIDCGTIKIKKSELTKRKNDEVHEESWVQCDDCERWIHQICGLYNTRQDKENKSAYSCPLCLMEKRKKVGDPSNLPEAPSANDIPRTKLSDWLERDVHRRVETRMKELAEERAEAENISYDKAFKALSTGGLFTIRQVTSTDRKHEVRELMKARYAHKDYPDEFPFRCKCIVVFQNIDGVDVVLFALYVYEHGEDNPSPNKRTVYVSYLDSVHFMMPRKMRTFIYQEILISYLDYAREKRFEQAFIWACPPLKGDDYIFYAKPEDQKIPKEQRLRQWYLEMLLECQKRSIVGKLTNMYDEYFNDKTLDAAAVPYFDGDYFPGEAENIIKELNDIGKKGKSFSGEKKALSKGKKSSGAIKDGVDESADYKHGGRDPVMQKFCDAISGMKESFMVAFLNCKDAKPENLIVSKEIMESRDAYNKIIEESGIKLSQSKDGDADEKQVDRFGRAIRVLDDDTEEIDCEFFNTRQAFLDLCRGNHYQFDELRRAKHTSMMVLWHLQNREAPKFVQQCFACNRELSSGVRHHCNVCADFDLCHECFQNPSTNRGSCTHMLEAVKVDNVPAASALTEEQRKERQRNIKLHIALIEHASQCKSTSCTSANCAKMKTYLKHGQVCKIKASGGCKICKRIWTLLRIHAQQCKNSNCPIPQCIAIRKRIRQLQLKQRAMDDRRREEMNRHHRLGQQSEAS